MTIVDTLSQHGVVPVIALDDAGQAVPLADALLEGGLPVAEITFRTDAAGAAIEAMATERPDALVGAGTVLTDAQVDAAHNAGARFGLAPGRDPETLAYAAAKGLPFAPGIMTPSGFKAGCTIVMFFLAMPAGGPRMLQNTAEPYAHTGIGFNPTGGMTLDNLGDWLARPSIRAVGGTWIATRSDIAKGNWAGVTAKSRAAVDRVAEIRAG